MGNVVLILRNTNISVREVINNQIKIMIKMPFKNIPYMLNLYVSISKAITQCTALHILLSIYSVRKMLSHVLQGGGRERGGC